MILPGDIVSKVLITKTDNKGRDTGEEGYDVNIYFESGEVIYDPDQYFHGLDLEPNGIYTYNGKKFTQIENWEA